MIGQETAEALALQALGYIAAQDDLLMQLLATTGATLGDLRAGAGDPAMLAAVVDFLLSDDALVADFARASGVPPDRLAEARAALPGGDIPHWT
jgi:hypothetical protein